MLTVDQYYQKYLKGKEGLEVVSNIHELRDEIEKLKETIENPNNNRNILDNEINLLQVLREYHCKAEETLLNLGENYTPSKLEQQDMDFNENLYALAKVTLSQHCFLGTSYGCEIELQDNCFKIEVSTFPLLVDEKSNRPKLEPYSEHLYNKDRFLSEMKELHIGEWREEYDIERFGCIVMDGVQWDLEFVFSNGFGPITINGNNSYPYNFNEFEKLFEIDFGLYEDI